MSSYLYIKSKEGERRFLLARRLLAKRKRLAKRAALSAKDLQPLNGGPSLAALVEGLEGIAQRLDRLALRLRSLEDELDLLRTVVSKLQH